MAIKSVEELRKHENKKNIDEIIIIKQKIEAPSELWDLVLECENLKTLILFDNQLEGLIPPNLGQLRQLKCLILAETQLEGSIPVEFGELKNLHCLALHNNQLEGNIPAELGNCTNLIFLYLFCNELKGSIPVALGNCTNLRFLDLSENQLTGSIPVEFGELKSLRKLFLHRNILTGRIPDELGQLTQLRKKDCDLSYNLLTGSMNNNSNNDSILDLINDELIRINNLPALHCEKLHKYFNKPGNFDNILNLLKEPNDFKINQNMISDIFDKKMLEKLKATDLAAKVDFLSSIFTQDKKKDS